MGASKMFRKARLPIAVAVATIASASYAQEESTESNQLALEEILVTAQKRQQNAMDVPVTVDTFSQQDIKNTGALNISDMDDYIPGFDAGDGVSQATLSIRGVSSSNISAGGDPSVATFYDDSYLPSAATTIAFSDIERVEVLKGPQGTLFGKNAAAGAVVMVPTRPSDEFEGFVAAKIGNYGFMRTEGMINVPLSDTVYVRANFLGNQHDGYVENASGARNSGEQDVAATRLSLWWDATDATAMQVSYEYDKVDNSARTAIGFSEYSYDLDPFNGVTANDVRESGESRDMSAISVKLFHDFSDEWSMKWVNSFREFETYNREEEDGTANPTTYLDTNNIFDNDILYSELQFNFNNDNMSAVFGANYSKENIHQETIVTALGDSVTRLVTNDITGNPMLQGMVYQGVQGQLAGSGLPQAQIDAIAQSYVDEFTAIDHLWNPNDWATFTTLINGSALPQLGPAYDGVAQALGTSMLFDPSYAGQEWRESVINDGVFESYGVYADVEYAFTDRFTMAAGVRYSNDEKTFSWLVPGVEFDRPTVPGTAPIMPVVFPAADGFDTSAGTLTASESWSKTTGRVVASYDISDDAMVFASYATGYKSGGFDSLYLATAVNPIAPEELGNMELGIKGDLFDGRARAQISYFDMSIDGRQRQVEAKPPGQTNALPRVISGDQQINGFEITFDVLMTENTKLGVVTTIRDTESEWEEYYNAVGELINDKSTGSTADAYTLTFDWTPEFAGGMMNFHADYIFAENTALDDPGAISSVMIDGVDVAIPGFGEDKKLLNARVEWADASDTFEVALWAKNILENEAVSSLGGRTLDVFGTGYLSVTPPRTYGIDLRYNF